MQKFRQRKYPVDRIYMLDNKQISSSECQGFIHKRSRYNKENEHCMACGKDVDMGQKYVILNIFGGSDQLHLDCYVADHPDKCILAEKIKYEWYFGLRRGIVYCRDFAK